MNESFVVLIFTLSLLIAGRCVFALFKYSLMCFICDGISLHLMTTWNSPRDGCHGVTVSRCHRVTVSPCHRVTVSPCHWSVSGRFSSSLLFNLRTSCVQWHPALTCSLWRRWRSRLRFDSGFLSLLQREVVSHDPGGAGRHLQDGREHRLRSAGVRETPQETPTFSY